MESELEIYYQPHKTRKREGEFVQSLIEKYRIPPENIFTHTYKLSPEFADKSIKIADVTSYVKGSDLTEKRKDKILLELSFLSLCSQAEVAILM